MAESTKKRGGRSDPRAPEAEEMVEVTLRRSVGRRGGPFYGPGTTMVPASLARSLELSPDLVETDGAGNPLPHTVAASVLGATTSTTAERDAHPIPERDPDTGDVEADDKGAPVSDTARRAAAIADNAEKGPDRQGGKLAGESGSLTDTKRAVHPLPGQVDATSEQSAQLAADAERDNASGGGTGGSAGRTSGSTGAGRIPGVEGDKPLTKSELRAQDEDVLIDLARRNKVSVPKKGGKKALVDKLYEARVTLD